MLSIPKNLSPDGSGDGARQGSVAACPFRKSYADVLVVQTCQDENGRLYRKSKPGRSSDEAHQG
jgi:hypothetical protein